MALMCFRVDQKTSEQPAGYSHRNVSVFLRILTATPRRNASAGFRTVQVATGADLSIGYRPRGLDPSVASVAGKKKQTPPDADEHNLLHPHHFHSTWTQLGRPWHRNRREITTLLSSSAQRLVTINDRNERWRIRLRTSPSDCKQVIFLASSQSVAASAAINSSTRQVELTESVAVFLLAAVSLRGQFFFFHQNYPFRMWKKKQMTAAPAETKGNPAAIFSCTNG